MSMRIVLLPAVAVCLIAMPCAAAVNKCTDGRGKVTYQDEPCAATPQSSKVDTSNAVSTRPSTSATQPPIGRSLPAGDDPGSRSAEGSWRGPAQFHFTVNGVRAAEAHMIGRMVIDLQPDGRVRGVIDEPGCKLSGLHTQFVTPTNASVDVTFSGCKDSRFNVRYSGHLATNPVAKEATLRLSAIAATAFAAKVSLATIDAVLKR